MATEFVFLMLIARCLSQVTPPLTSWTPYSTPSLPEATSGLITGYDSDTKRIWLLGGFGVGANNIWYYSINDNSFTDTLNTLPDTVDMSAQAFTQIDGSIYYANEDSSGVHTIQKFDMSTGSVDSVWDTNSNNQYPIQNRDSPCFATDGQYIFVISGDAGSAAGQQTQIYDTVNDEWATSINLISGRARSSCAVSPDKNTLYVFGGTYNGNTPVSISAGTSNIETTIEKLDISDKTSVSTINDGSWAVVYDGGSQYIMGNNGNNYYSRAVTVGQYIYLIGGRDRYTNPTDTVTFFDPSIDDIVFSVASVSNTARSSPGVVAVDGVIYSFGGTASTGYTSSWEVSNALTTSGPTTNQPTTDQPTTDQPTTAVPTTANPTTDQPTTANPTTMHPTTDNPTTSQPTTSNPTTSTPTTSEPTTSVPTTAFPTTDNPTTDSPTTDEPTTNKPTIVPSDNPTGSPVTASPSVDPTFQPTKQPLRTNHPTADPTMQPTNDPTTDPSLDPTCDPTTDPTNNPTKSPTVNPTTPSPTLKAGAGNSPTSPGQQKVTDNSGENTLNTPQSANVNDKKKDGLDTNTLIIIGSGGGFFVICLLIVLLIRCHRKNKTLAQALEKTMSISEMADVTVSTLGTTTNPTTTDENNHIAVNSQSPMVGVFGEINNGVISNDEEEKDEIHLVSSDDIGELNEGNKTTEMDQDTDNEDNEMLYSKATKGANFVTAGGGNVGPGGGDKMIEMEQMKSDAGSSDEDEDGMYGKGKSSDNNSTAGSQWNSHR